MHRLPRRVSFDLATVTVIAAVSTALVARDAGLAAALVGGAAMLGFAAGLVLHRSHRAAPWWLLAVGVAVSVLSHAGAVTLPLARSSIGASGFPAASLIILVAVLLLLWRRVGSRALDALGEVGLLVAGLGFATATLVTTSDALPDNGARAAAVGVPLVDVMVLWLLARLVTLTDRHPVAYRYVLGGMLCLFTVDAMVATGAAHRAVHPA